MPVTITGSRAASESQAATPAAQPAQHHGGWVLAASLVAALVLDVVFFNGYFASDDYAYFTTAQQLLQFGRYTTPPALGSSRLAIVGWLVLTGTILPPDVQWAAASFIVWHLVLVGLTCLLGWTFLDRRVGLMAAWGVATIGLFVVYAGCMLPDMLVACTWVFALYAFLRGLRARHRPRPGRSHAWLLAAGLGVGLGYMAKEASLVLLPFFFVVWLIAEIRSPRWAAVGRGAVFAAGVGIMLAAEVMTFRRLAPATAHRLTWVAGEIDETVRKSVVRYGSSPWHRLLWVDQRLNRDVFPPGLKPALVVGFVLFPILCRRQWAIYALPLWAFAYQTWGTMNLSAYVPPTIQARYYIPVVPFALVILGAVLVRAWDWTAGRLTAVPARRIAQGAALTILALYPLSGLGGPNRLAGRLYRTDLVRGAAKALALATQRPARPIVVDPALARRIVPLLLWRQTRSDVVYLSPLRTEVVDIPLVASSSAPVAAPEWTPRDPPTGRAATIERPGARWQFLALNRQRASVPTDPLLELGELFDAARPRRWWNLAAPDEQAIQFGHACFTVDGVTTMTPARTRFDELLHVLRGAPPVPPASAAGKRSVVLYELCTDIRTPLDGGSRIDLPLNSGAWRLNREAEAELTDLADGLCCQSQARPATYAWLVPAEETFAPCRAVSAESAAFFEVEVASLSVEKAELVLDALDLNGKPQSQQRRRLRLVAGENLLPVHQPAGVTDWRPAFKLTGAGEFRLRRLSIARAPVLACVDLNPAQRRYRASHRDSSAVRVQPLPESGFRANLDGLRGEYCWIAPASRAHGPLLEMPAGTRSAFYLSVQQTAGVTSQLVMQFFSDPARQTQVDERRLLVHDGLNEINVVTGAHAVYPRVVYKVFGDGEFAVVSLQCVVSAPEQPSRSAPGVGPDTCTFAAPPPDDLPR